MSDLHAVNRQGNSLADKIDASGDCWLWTGATSNGYGSVYYKGRTRRAHRVVWEILVGLIAEGKEIDHLCRNPPCCNPDHLDPVTRKEHVSRGQSFSGKNVRKTHCPHGHEYTEDNIIVGSYGGRVCRTCRRTWEREYNRKQREHDAG